MSLTALDLKKAYSELPEMEQVLVASFIAADLMAKDSEFAANLSRRHDEMDRTGKNSHAHVMALHEKMEKEGL